MTYAWPVTGFTATQSGLVPVVTVSVLFVTPSITVTVLPGLPVKLPLLDT